MSNVDLADAVEDAPHAPTTVPSARVRGVGSEGYGSRARSIAFRFPLRYRVVWIAVALLLLLVLVSGRETLGSDSLQLITALTGILLIAATGQLLVIMLGGIDLSVPAVMTVAAAIVVRQTDGANGELAGAVVLALLAGLAIGLFSGALIAFLKINALIVTLAVNGMILGALRWWTGPSFSPTGAVPPDLASLAKGSVGWISTLLLVALGLAVAVALVLRRTRIGRRYVASGASPAAAEVLGIRPRWFQLAAYAIAGLLYAIAGLLIAGYVGRPDATIGTEYQLQTIVAVALAGAALAGGPASVMGTAAGAFFLVLLSQYLAVKGVSGGVSVLLQGVVLVAAVAMVTGMSGGGSRWRPAWLRRAPSSP